ncbi:arylsulfotransferase family protein [Patulibacter sp. NPDC049589]|uniref:arylsulfotransferase family protein n=1 Tax=Patulibacter sp. NPDC049589 TaxID=3154731 RepID=UPI0034152B1C
MPAPAPARMHRAVRSAPPHRAGRRGRAALAGLLTLTAAAAAAPSAGADGPPYVTRPDLRPTRVTVTTPATNVAPGYVFATPKGGGIDSGAEIFDNAGQLVWFRPAKKRGTSILDLKPQTYEGKPVATFWEGLAVRGYGFGAFHIVDQNMNEIGRVSPNGKGQMDFHEFTLTPQGTALGISYKPVRGSTTAVKGGARNDLIMRNLIQEIDPKTNEVLWEWDITKGVSPAESYLPIPARPEVAYDYIHANSVNLDADGNLLVSSRHTHTIYKVDKKTKKIIWRLGGKKSNFKMGPGARFAWQHDAHRQPDGTISLFDNASSIENDKGKRSKGLVLNVDEAANTATVAKQFVNPVPKVDNTQGNLQALPNGNWFVGWGGTGRNVSEFSADGTQIFEAKYASKRTESYRAYRSPWVAQPQVAPKAVARRSSSSVAVRVSWNGATTVAAWRVVGGASATTLVPRIVSARTGFETLIRVPDRAGESKVVAVEALDVAGNVLSRSKAIAVGAKY